MADWLHAGLAALGSGCHLVRPCSARLTSGNTRQLHSGVLRWPAIASLHLLSRVDVIVPDRFQMQEGLTSDDVQDGRLVTHNEVL
jgi:hypothetical protein